ncbi:MAG: hypothetical protein M3R15_34230 [Acidobacteriota bacterium]|nr:hypothetical protein [Acidobacteriota bacterium]
MTRPKCSCASFEKLAGASVHAYIAMFLDELNHQLPTGVRRYRCRECGREWEKRPPEVKSEGTRPTLVRID